MRTNYQKIILEKIKELESQMFDFELDNDGDEVDAIQCNLIAGITLEHRDRNHIQLGALREALNKFKDNTYGICEECDEKIAAKRLLICPETKFCIKCAEIIEKRNKEFIR